MRADIGAGKLPDPFAMASILIVDDLISIHEMLEAVISPTGHKTLFATDGEKGLAR